MLDAAAEDHRHGHGQAERQQQRELRIVGQRQDQGRQRQRQKFRMPWRPAQKYAEDQCRQHQDADPRDARRTLSKAELKTADINDDESGQ